MHRGNYKNIGNNFISGGVYNQQQQQPLQSPQRQTRSNNMNLGNGSQQMTSPTTTLSNNIAIKTEVPIMQQQQQTNLAATTAVVTTTPMHVESSMSEAEMMKLRKINFKKKVSGKEKRVKQNKKLYRMLTPRNAIAALNELTVGQSVGETVVVPVQGNKFEAEVVLSNVKYKGTGTSKMQAKNSACEKALRDLVINKFRQMKQDPPPSESTEDVSMEETDTTEVPMLQLASFALHKLFAEWEAEGFEIPLPKVTEPATSQAPSIDGSAAAAKPPAVPKPPKVKTELPPSNETMHPVMLLSVMRPCTQYNDLGSQGITPNIMHTVGATVDGQSFIGQGRSKKEARKRIATSILQKLFNWQGSCC